MNNLAYSDVIPDLSPLYKYKRGEEAVDIDKKRKNAIGDNAVEIIHTMADGSIRDSIDNYVIPYNDTTSIAYELLKKWTIEKQNSQII